MHRVEKTVLVAHAAKQMFTLVDTVEDYPKFLPWCGGVTLHERTDSITSATICINYHGIKQHFTTRNQKIFPNEMQMTFVDGPFKHFSGLWQFHALSTDACKVMFRLEYEFANIYLEKLIAPVFNQIAATFVDSFVAQAEKTASTS
jgi:ribosome-associated toxin RatA of RatAB toxin-antitoxin module